MSPGRHPIGLGGTLAKMPGSLAWSNLHSAVSGWLQPGVPAPGWDLWCTRRTHRPKPGSGVYG